MRRAPFAVLLAGFLVAATFVSSAGAAQAPVSLATTSTFAILAGSGITNTGATVINGDVGTFPTTTESGFATAVVIGANDDGNAVTQGAKNDLVTAYNDAAGRTPVTTIPTSFGGSTLNGGVYSSSAGTFGLTGTLTLNGQGDPTTVFIFQAASTVITASSSNVVLENGAQACNVSWLVGSSETLGSSTSFVGTTMALTSITLNSAATVVGRLLARNGAVTLIGNTVTVPTVRLTSTPVTTTTTVPTTTTVAPTPTTVAPTTATTAMTATTVAPVTPVTPTTIVATGTTIKRVPKAAATTTTTTLPAAATSGVIPVGFPATGGGGTSGTKDQGLLWFGAIALLGAGGAAIIGARRRRFATSPTNSSPGRPKRS